MRRGGQPRSTSQFARELYEGLLKNWIYGAVERPSRPALKLGDMPIQQITENEVEHWHLACKGRKHGVACAKAYRLLSEIMIYASEKRAVIRNPVHIERCRCRMGPGPRSAHARRACHGRERDRNAVPSHDSACDVRSASVVGSRWDCSVATFNCLASE